nr:MAG TPA: hypothetical protein [Caudoviricetes sp.]
MADLHKIFQSSFFVERGVPVRVPLFLCENAFENKPYVESVFIKINCIFV